MAEDYQVVHQRESTAIGPDGRFTPSMVVGFKTSKGLTGSVTIPETQYTPENVHQAITDKVSMMHDVQNL